MFLIQKFIIRSLLFAQLIHRVLRAEAFMKPRGAIESGVFHLIQITNNFNIKKCKAM